MKTTKYAVDMPYTRAELTKLFAAAEAEDVDKAGRYDARSAAINVWSHPWTDPQAKQQSETLGSFYVNWGDENRLWQIETDEGASLEDLLGELAILERKALGAVKHGREKG